MRVVGVVGQLTVGATVKLKTALDVFTDVLHAGKASTDQKYVPAGSAWPMVKLVWEALTRVSFVVGAGGFCVPKWIRYLSAFAAADQLSVGVALAVLPFAGPVRVNEPGALQIAPVVRNVAQPLDGKGQVVFVFLATTRHSRRACLAGCSSSMRW